MKNSYPEYAAIVVAGGRSSRLGGTPKASLSNGSKTLLASSLQAVATARQRVVVGPSDLPVPADVKLTREDPPFSGPAAAITAGVRALSPSCEWTCVIAVDMPRIAEAIDALLEVSRQAPADIEGFFGVSGEIAQPLVGIYRTENLRRVFDTDTAHQSVRRFLRQLNLQAVPLDGGVTDDVDTWESAHATGFDSPQWN
ncbi:molybdenum cofactor guanylyltransferase [Rothia amarae]|uniref:molybdenum cofactor guanylyltransferase n=1 Tax=Rothia amarae TaxID=169480 RepID=UPI0031DE9A84